MILPQEMDVWYVFPALRKQLAQIFVQEHNLKQKDAAALLGLTNSAVSQYLKDKRGQELSFTDSEKQLIRDYAAKIVANPTEILKYMTILAAKLKESGSVCALHKSLDATVPANCDICKHISTKE